MAELVRRKPLAGRADIRARGLVLSARPEMRVELLIAAGIEAIDGAVRLSPTEWLLVREGKGGSEILAAHAGTHSALVQDMSSGLAAIDLTGPAAFDLLGVSALARGEAGSLTTRIAQLRITLLYRNEPERNARLLVDRPSADYLWHCLAAKLGADKRTACCNATTLLDGCLTK